MPCVGFEPKIPASERAKTVHALYRSATVTGIPLLETEITGLDFFQLCLEFASRGLNLSFQPYLIGPYFTFRCL
jgi:hypothetical protein